jgi:hypothetical protein
MAYRQPPASLRGIVRDYCGYDERSAEPLSRRETPHGGVVLILNLGERLDIRAADSTADRSADRSSLEPLRVVEPLLAGRPLPRRLERDRWRGRPERGVGLGSDRPVPRAGVGRDTRRRDRVEPTPPRRAVPPAGRTRSQGDRSGAAVQPGRPPAPRRARHLDHRHRHDLWLRRSQPPRPRLPIRSGPARPPSTGPPSCLPVAASPPDWLPGAQVTFVQDPTDPGVVGCHHDRHQCHRRSRSRGHRLPRRAAVGQRYVWCFGTYRPGTYEA